MPLYHISLKPLRIGELRAHVPKCFADGCGFDDLKGKRGIFATTWSELDKWSISVVPESMDYYIYEVYPVDEFVRRDTKPWTDEYFIESHPLGQPIIQYFLFNRIRIQRLVMVAQHIHTETDKPWWDELE